MCRDHVTVQLAEGKAFSQNVANPAHVREVLGPERNMPEIGERKLASGIAIGLSVSGSGGDILIVEADAHARQGEHPRHRQPA